MKNDRQGAQQAEASGTFEHEHRQTKQQAKQNAIEEYKQERGLY